MAGQLILAGLLSREDFGAIGLAYTVMAFVTLITNPGIDVMGTAHHIFDGITFRNTDVAILAGKKELTGATNLTVRNCRFEDVGFGIWTEYAGSREFYTADNLFLGRLDRYRLIGWTGARWDA